MSEALGVCPLRSVMRVRTARGAASAGSKSPIIGGGVALGRRGGPSTKSRMAPTAWNASLTSRSRSSTLRHRARNRALRAGTTGTHQRGALPRERAFRGRRLGVGIGHLPVRDGPPSGVEAGALPLTGRVGHEPAPPEPRRGCPATVLKWPRLAAPLFRPTGGVKSPLALAPRPGRALSRGGGGDGAGHLAGPSTEKAGFLTWAAICGDEGAAMALLGDAQVEVRIRRSRCS